MGRGSKLWDCVRIIFQCKIPQMQVKALSRKEEDI